MCYVEEARCFWNHSILPLMSSSSCCFRTTSRPGSSATTARVSTMIWWTNIGWDLADYCTVLWMKGHVMQWWSQLISTSDCSIGTTILWTLLCKCSICHGLLVLWYTALIHVFDLVFKEALGYEMAQIFYIMVSILYLILCKDYGMSLLSLTILEMYK